MEFHLESPVVSGDGTEMGKIKRVIFDPRSNEVKSVIVEKGVFFPHDVAVPIEDIRAAEPGRVELSISRDEFGKLPEFFEADYTWPDANWSAPSGWRSGAVMWPLGWYPNGAGFERPDTTSEIVHRAQEQDMQNAVIGQGSEVLAKGGEKVGEVHNLQIDPSSQKPTSMSLRRGFLFTEDVEIPSAWIESYDDGTVQLNVDKSIVEQLAETKQAVHSEPRG